MSDLYERLPARITEDSDGCEDTSAQALVDALRAVLELHKPYQSRLWGICCQCCSNPEDDDPAFGPYPCDTVRAIARALDVPIGDQL